MLEYQDALALVVAKTLTLAAIEKIPQAAAFGRVLAVDVAADADLPPFNKATMDGFAVRAADVQALPATLCVVGDIPAGCTTPLTVGAGQAAAIMTGAPLPAGADAVVQVEWTSGFGAPEVTIARGVPAGVNVSAQGGIAQQGQPLLSRGCSLEAEELALLATLGVEPVPVFRLPSVALLSTGDELVPAHVTPVHGQIRDANGPALAGLVRSLGLVPVPLGVARDEKAALKAAVARGLEHDCLLVSGGVSAGAYDFVGDVLEELGVTVHVRKVAIKPGRPTVFGTHPSGIVFGLPGNPVSALVIARVLAVPALCKLMGLADGGLRLIRARLTAAVQKKPDRLWFVHGALELIDGEARVRPITSKGSADLPALAAGRCLISLPIGCSELPAGALVEVAVWPRSL